MNYSVVWMDAAEQRLIEIWLSSRFRHAVTRTAQSIERDLEAHPFDGGESRDFGQRILLEFPLGVIYEVRSEQNLVRVLRAWEIKRRPT